MAVTSVGSGSTANLAQENVARNGGGRTEKAAKGGNTSDPVDMVSVTGAATVQQPPVSETGTNGEGATGGAPPVAETLRQENIPTDQEASKGGKVNMRV